MANYKSIEWWESIQGSRSIVELKDNLNSILIEIDNLPASINDEEYTWFFDDKVWYSCPKFADVQPEYSPSHDMKFILCGRECVSQPWSYDDESILYYSDSCHDFRILNTN